MALKSCEIAQQRSARLTDKMLSEYNECHNNSLYCLCDYSELNSDANRPKYPATLSLHKEGNGKYSTLCCVNCLVLSDLVLHGVPVVYKARTIYIGLKQLTLAL